MQYPLVIFSLLSLFFSEPNACAVGKRNNHQDPASGQSVPVAQFQQAKAPTPLPFNEEEGELDLEPGLPRPEEKSNFRIPMVPPRPAALLRWTRATRSSMDYTGAPPPQGPIYEEKHAIPLHGQALAGRQNDQG